MKPVKIEKYGCTDIGHKRQLNEDYFRIEDFIFILADGMGGHNGGEVASHLAVEKCMDIFKKLLKKDTLERYDTLQVQQIIRDTIFKVNTEVYQKSLTDVRLHGMGTTLVVALYQQPNYFHIANVGDSRAYVYRKDSLKLLSEDHSVTARLLKNGTITQNEAKNHPFRHHLTRSIGNSENVVPFVQLIHVSPDDRILLCSDGLWNAVSNNVIIDTLQKECSCKQMCLELHKKANEVHSQDNITSILIKIKK